MADKITEVMAKSANAVTYEQFITKQHDNRYNLGNKGNASVGRGAGTS